MFNKSSVLLAAELGKRPARDASYQSEAENKDIHMYLLINLGRTAFNVLFSTAAFEYYN